MFKKIIFLSFMLFSFSSYAADSVMTFEEDQVINPEVSKVFADESLHDHDIFVGIQDGFVKKTLLNIILEESKIRSRIAAEDEIVNLVDKDSELMSNLVNYILNNGFQYKSGKVLKKIAILDRKIEINRIHGNDLAVKRDVAKRHTLVSVNFIFEYLDNVSLSFSGYLDEDAFFFESDKQFKQIAEIRKFIEENDSQVVDSGNLSNDYHSNLSDLKLVYYLYKDLHSYITDNSANIVRTHWIEFFKLKTWIDYLNDNDVASYVNKRISVVAIDFGGTVVFLVLFLMIMSFYPFVFKVTGTAVERFILKEEALNDTVDSLKEFTYLELRKPIKVLLVFFGLDLSTQALLYKTDYVDSVGEVSFVVYIFITSWIFLKIINSIVSSQIERLKKEDVGMRKELFNLIIYIVKAITFVVALIIVLTHFGISISAILSTLGIGGLAFALAAQDLLKNLFGGVAVMIDNVFQLDEWVKIGNVEGTVAEIGLRSTTIRTFDNALITIPNSQISTSDVMNWNRRKVGRRIKMWVGVTYESNMDDIRNAVDEIRYMLKNHEGISNTEDKFKLNERALRFYNEANIHGIKNTQLVFVDKFNTYSIDILIYCFSKTVNWEEWLTVKEDVLYKIAAIIEKNNLEFAYPTEVKIEKSIY